MPGDEIVLLDPYTSGRNANRHSSDPQAAIGLPWSIDDSTGHVIVNVSKSNLSGIDHLRRGTKLYHDHDVSVEVACF